MTPDSLMIELETRGISLRRSGDRLMVRDPSRALTPGLRVMVRKHKTALMARLNVPDAGEQLTPTSASDPDPWPRLQVETWPADLVNESLLWAMLENSRCANFYAADRDLCEALDSENVTAIAAAQARFDRALIHARHLATEILSVAK